MLALERTCLGASKATKLPHVVSQMWETAHWPLCSAMVALDFPTAALISPTAYFGKVGVSGLIDNMVLCSEPGEARPFRSSLRAKTATKPCARPPSYTRI